MSPPHPRSRGNLLGMKRKSRVIISLSQCKRPVKLSEYDLEFRQQKPEGITPLLRAEIFVPLPWVS